MLIDLLHGRRVVMNNNKEPRSFAKDSEVRVLQKRVDSVTKGAILPDLKLIDAEDAHQLDRLVEHLTHGNCLKLAKFPQLLQVNYFLLPVDKQRDANHRDNAKPEGRRAKDKKALVCKSPHHRISRCSQP